MSKIIVQGGSPLSGSVTPSANKNSILALIPATILCDSPVTFTNVPSSTSVRIMLQIFEKLGGKVKQVNENTIELDSRPLNSFSVDEELAQKEQSEIDILTDQP